MLSVLLGMLPVFGTFGQRVLIELHRASSTVFLLVTVAYILLGAAGPAKKG
jgi:hypothetical protein